MKSNSFYSAAVAVSSIAISGVMACTTQSDVTITFYGYPDNSPPGAGTAYNCGGRNYIAGGTGTYDDPLTMATASGELSQCEIVYLPYLEKYVRYEDECAQCETDWNNGIYHIDIWTGSSTVNGGDDQIQCEDDLTPNSQTIVRQPDSGLEVDSQALYDGSCHTGDTYPNQDISNFCGSGSGSGGGSSCSWAGHCAGASCTTYNDCSDSLVCTNGVCASS